MPSPRGLSSPPTKTRGPIIQKVRRHGTCPLRLLVGARFQVSFTPLIGVLFTFPSRYWCTIGRQGVFRLGGWSPHVRTGFHVPRPTRGPVRAICLRDCHPLRPGLTHTGHCPGPLSLATTRVISADVCSSGY